MPIWPAERMARSLDPSYAGGTPEPAIGAPAGVRQYVREGVLGTREGRAAKARFRARALTGDEGVEARPRAARSDRRAGWVFGARHPIRRQTPWTTTCVQEAGLQIFPFW